VTTRQYARLVSEWIANIGLDPHLFGTHSLRRTKATLIYRRTGNLRAVKLLLGHTKIESTVRYLPATPQWLKAMLRRPAN
jgi:integrase